MSYKDTYPWSEDGHIMRREHEDGRIDYYDMDDVGCSRCGGSGWSEDDDDVCGLCEGNKFEM